MSEEQREPTEEDLQIVGPDIELLVGNATAGDPARYSALINAIAARLRAEEERRLVAATALRVAATRMEILLDRMRVCNDLHQVSREEAPVWVEHAIGAADAAISSRE